MGNRARWREKTQSYQRRCACFYALVFDLINAQAIIMGGRGGKKHQLSSLLYAAHANREELEDKIAQAKANRKSGGQKYGASVGSSCFRTTSHPLVQASDRIIHCTTLQIIVPKALRAIIAMLALALDESTRALFACKRVCEYSLC